MSRDRSGSELSAIRVRQQAAVAELGQRALGGAEPAELCAAAVRALSGPLDAEAAAALAVTPDGERLEVRAAVGRLADQVGSTAWGTGRSSPEGYAVATAAPVVSVNIRHDPRFSSPRPLTAIRAIITAPVVLGDHPWGAVAVYGARRAQYDADDIAFVQAVANVLAAAFARLEVEGDLRESRQRLELALSVGGLGTWELQLPDGAIHWSAGMRTIFGIGEDEPIDVDRYTALVHPDDRDRVLAEIGASIEEDREHRLVHRIVRDDGETRWIEGWGRVLHDRAGRPDLAIGVVSDVTERRRIEELKGSLLARERSAREEAERAREQIAFLAEAGAALSRALDTRAGLRNLARRCVTVLGEACIVDLLHGHDPVPEALESVAIAHRDPFRVAEVERLRAHVLPQLDAWRMVEVLATREPSLYRDLTPEVVGELHGDAREVAMQLGVSSLIVVPLVARGRVLGAITFGAGADQRFGPDELDLAGGIAERAAFAVDNGRLLAERTRVAKSLQRALLPPELPQIDGVDLAARHKTSADENDISGDFYDFFEGTDDVWWIVVGDVCGKGPEAAALTGVVRNTIRTAVRREDRPERVAALVNEVLYDQTDETQFCTAVLLRIEPGADGLRATMVSGGHPRPLLVDDAGRTELLPTQGTLLGAIEDVLFEPVDIVLAPGSAIVLYTDGVTEARSGDDFLGETGLLELVAASSRRSAGAIASTIEQGALAFQAGRPRDDMAVVVVRARATAVGGP